MVSIGPRIQITGESAYRQALSRIISETKSLNSEMDLMVAKFNKADTAIEKNKQKQEMLTRQIEQAKTQLDKFDEGMHKAIKVHEDAKKAYESNQKSLEKLTKEKEQAEQVIAKLTQEYGEENQYVQAAKKHYAELETAIADTTEESERLSKEVDRSGKVLADWETATNKAELELVNFQNELKNLPNNFQLVGEKITDVGDKIQGMGDKLTTFVTAPLVAAGTAFVKWSSDFTDGMAKIYTIADQSKVPMSEMRQELIDLSNTTGFSLEDLAEAEYQAVSASVATEDSIKFLTQATDLARGGFTSTTKAVDILSTVMNSYGKDAYDVAYISDVLLKTQNDGKTIVDEMAAGLGTIIPLASAYNVGLEDVSAALATMTKQGVPTTRAITFLRAAFTELEKDGSDVNELLYNLEGKTFAQMMDSGMNLADVLEVLYNHVGRDQEEFAKLFGNVRSSQAVVTLLAGNFGILRDEIDKMYGATGQTEYALSVLETPSLKAKRALQQLKNSGMELGTTLINELYPYFIKVIDGIKSLTTWFANLDEETKTSIVNWLAWATAAGPVLKVIGLMTSGFGKLVTGIGDLSAKFIDLSFKLATTHPKLAGMLLDVGLAIPKFALLAGGVLAAGAAFVGLATATQSATEKHREEIASLWGLDAQMQDHIDKSKELEMAYADKKKAALDEMNASLGQAETVKLLVDEYNKLIDSNGQVLAGHQDLADVYINQLAQALGMEVEQVKALIEENGKFGDSIQKTIDDMIRRAEMAAYEQILTDAIVRQAQAERELEQQQSDLVVQQARVTQAQQNTKQAYEDMIAAQQRSDPEIGRYEQAWRDAVEAESQATAAEQELRDSLDLTRTRVTAAEQDAQDARNRIKETTEGAMADTAKAIENGGDEVANAASNVSSRASGEFSIDGDGIGYYIDKGLADGIDSHAHLIAAAAARAAKQAEAASRYTLSIESPSKVMAEVGKYFDLGFAQGIKENVDSVVRSVDMLAQSAANGMQMSNYSLPGTAGGAYQTASKTINAPINVDVVVGGSVSDVDALASVIADRINMQILRKSEVFG